MECSLGIETTHCVLVSDTSYVQVTGHGTLVDLDSLVFCLPLVSGPRLLPRDVDKARMALAAKVRMLAEHHQWGMQARTPHFLRPTYWVPLAEAREWLRKHLTLEVGALAALDSFDWDALTAKVDAAAPKQPARSRHLKRARDENDIF